MIVYTESLGLVASHIPTFLYFQPILILVWPPQINRTTESHAKQRSTSNLRDDIREMMMILLSQPLTVYHNYRDKMRDYEYPID